MTIREFALLADENLHPDVVAFLRSEHFDVQDVHETSLRGTEDSEVLRFAFRQHRVVVTHDEDFGVLAMSQRFPVIGVVYLRPGHLLPSYTISTLRTLLARSIQLPVPFVVVAHRIGRRVHIRVRSVDRL